MTPIPFADLDALALKFRNELAPPHSPKKVILLYAYNGTGKTRLSTVFKDIGKRTGQPDTLYFNAFTEDLFSWDNDLDEDNERYLILHPSSAFLSGLAGVDMDTKVYNILKLFADFEFNLDNLPLVDADGKVLRTERIVRFSRKVQTVAGSTRVENIKISRSEENLFIWCFYLAVLQMALDGDPAYTWVKHVYVDDPISSMDESNAIAVANHLAGLLTNAASPIPAVISTHHTLFFNVLCNELKNASKYLLTSGEESSRYLLSETSGKPFLHHLATLVELDQVRTSGTVKRHHFNMLRCVMEQTSVFLGLRDWKACITLPDSQHEKALHERMINIMSHADYLINEPDLLNSRYKDDFGEIFANFVNAYPFDQAMFPSTPTGVA